MDTLSFTSAEAENFESGATGHRIDQDPRSITSTFKLLEASQDSMAVSLAEGQQRAEENKEAADRAWWKSRQNSDELDKFGNNWGSLKRNKLRKMRACRKKSARFR